MKNYQYLYQEILAKANYYQQKHEEDEVMLKSYKDKIERLYKVIDKRDKKIEMLIDEVIKLGGSK